MKFKAEVSKLLDIVINSLYSEKYIFLRELISNASDACDKLKYMSLMDKKVKPHGELKITVIPNVEEQCLIISDNGIGMNRDDLVNHLGTIAKSGTAEFVNNAKDNGSMMNLIGQFGVGFYSAFMVASKVEILTKRADEEQAYKWTSDGVSGFEIKEAEKKQAGTEIKLFLKDGDKNFLDTIELRHIIRTYSDHVEYPIELDLGKAGIEQVNTASAIWARHKADITQKQYVEFYHHVSKNFDEPWLTLHFKAEGNIEYTGLLYIPSTPPYDLFQPDRKQSLKLYVKKVFVSDAVEELLPHYLRFVKGVVDSADLPLNISREMLQHNVLIAKIKNAIVTRVLKELKNKAKNEEDYLVFWKAFGTAFKEGIYEDLANREEIAGLCRFNTTHSLEMFTSLDKYMERAKEGQKSIYYITGDDVKVLANNPQLEAFKEKGIEVLLLTDPIDEFWVQTLGKYKDFALKHVNSAEIDLSFERKGKKAEEGSLQKLIDRLTEMFKNEVGKVRATEKLSKSPVSLTVEDGQMSIHLERLMKNHNQQVALGSSRVLEINPYHPLIIKLSEIDDAAKIEEVAKMLMDQAKIAEGEAISDPSFFAEKLSEYILKGM